MYRGCGMYKNSIDSIRYEILIFKWVWKMKVVGYNVN